MRFDKSYNRDEFIDFITDFLPNDFEEDIKPVDFSHGIIKKITRLGKCEEKLNKIEVFEIIHTSLSDARITLSREIFKFIKQTW